ncbi:MAG TPA: hypothetical protein VHE33_11200 [Acidobacteriaceae bacterium]|nr:hypothetical protein [Acidobacteriaceae bacterium]
MASDSIPSVAIFQPAVLSHLPLVLLLLCPVFILLGAALPPLRGWPWRLAALLLLGIGTAGLFFAIPGPQHYDPRLMPNPAAGAVQWIYRSLVMEARIIFMGLTAIYVGVILLPEVLRRRDNRLFSTVLPLSFLLLYSAGAVFLMQTTDSAAVVTQTLGIGADDTGASHRAEAPVSERK